MTKSEATAILQYAHKALATLERDLWHALDISLKDRERMYAEIRGAIQEINNIRDMAQAELGKGR